MAKTQNNGRAALWLRYTLVALAAALLSCGGPDGGGDNPDDEKYISGTVTLRGNAPAPLIMIQANDGVLYIVQSSRLADDLRQLDGMSIRVSARVYDNPQESESPIVSISWYELLPLRTGERPIIGYIGSNPPDYVWLIDEVGTRYDIEGDFKDVLMHFDGSKVWVVGDIDPSVTELRARIISVTEYGMIRGGDSGVRF